jgi:hypothetical protein
MRTQARYTAFLSYADPDKSLVQELAKLFGQFGEQVFFAKVNLPMSGTPEWRRAIAEAVKESASFVHICTRHSLRRPWVLYESGVADACAVPRFAARVSNVAVSEMVELPGPGVFVYELFDREHLRQLVIRVIHGKRGGDRSIVENEVNRGLQAVRAVKRIADRICSLARTRWVFIAGNAPHGATRVEHRLTMFVQRLAETALDKGFSIVSCPHVRPVGLLAARMAIEWGAEHTDCFRETFRIGGIYPVDRMTRELSVSPEARKKWLDQLIAFRRSYLDGLEWLVLIGGNEGTFDEYKAAKSLESIKILALPCFAGAAAQIAKKYRNTMPNCCCTCKTSKASCRSGMVDEIVQLMMR